MFVVGDPSSKLEITTKKNHTYHTLPTYGMVRVVVSVR